MSYGRIGWVRFPARYYQGPENHSEVVEIFKQMEFIPTYVDKIDYFMQFKVVGYSKMFDELKEGELLPEYTLHIYKNEDGSVELKKVERV